jgi:predicted NBD/HSP70 family sugar kinase
MALAELWFGRPEIRQVRDFIMILVEEGLGTGIVFDGQVYHGVVGAAGEFGHMIIGHNAPIACASGSRECWEAFASERAALGRYADLCGADSVADVTFAQMMDRALSGDSLAKSALTETAHYLGIGISNLIKGLSPEAVIVGGQIARVWPLIGEGLRNAVEENSICRGLPSAKVIASSLGANPRLMGALSLFLRVSLPPRFQLETIGNTTLGHGFGAFPQSRMSLVSSSTIYALGYRNSLTRSRCSDTFARSYNKAFHQVIRSY